MSERSFTDKERLDWLEMKVVNVRTPLVYGSGNLFWASPDGEEVGPGMDETPSNLRAQIDQCMAKDSQ